jgi:ABC-type Co2+ transport system permease subunit
VKALAVVAAVVGGFALSILFSGVVLFAFVGLLFCDAPGATTASCVAASTREMFWLLAPKTLPLGVGGIAVSVAISSVLKRRAPRPESPPPSG